MFSEINPLEGALSPLPLWGLGGGGTWVNFRWVCAASLLEPLPHYSLFCGHIIDPILVTLRGKITFRNPNLITFFSCIYLIEPFNLVILK